MTITELGTSFKVPSLTLSSKRPIQTLLELVKPLTHNTALVRLGDMQEITIALKTPLKEQTLYFATLLKDHDSILLKYATPLPKTHLRLLKEPAHLSLHALLQELKNGKSPQKVLFELLSDAILQNPNKEQLSHRLNELLAFIEFQEPTFVVQYAQEKGYIKFKRPKREFKEKMVEFEAFFMSLGPLNGRISYIQAQKSAHIYTVSMPSLNRLNRLKGLLGFPVSLHLLKEIKQEAPKRSLLDIKG